MYAYVFELRHGDKEWSAGAIAANMEEAEDKVFLAHHDQTIINDIDIIGTRLFCLKSAKIKRTPEKGDVQEFEAKAMVGGGFLMYTNSETTFAKKCAVKEKNDDGILCLVYKENHVVQWR